MEVYGVSIFSCINNLIEDKKVYLEILKSQKELNEHLVFLLFCKYVEIKNSM